MDELVGQYPTRTGIKDVLCPAGQEMLLDDQTPLGLFEDEDENRYIITDDFDWGPIAVVLRHRFIEPFTWHALPRYSSTAGRWWGPYKIRMMSKATRSLYPNEPGTILITETGISIVCYVGLQGSDNIVQLGQLDQSDVYGEADCWTIEAAETKFVFCRRSRYDTFSYGATPHEPAKPGKRDSVVQLHSLSVLEKIRRTSTDAR